TDSLFCNDLLCLALLVQGVNGRLLDNCQVSSRPHDCVAYRTRLRDHLKAFAVVQKTTIDTLHKEGKTQKVIAKEAGCSQRSVSKHINREAKGRKRCGRKKCTSNRDNRTLERIVKQNPFKNVGEIHKEWTAAGVSASRTTTHRRMQDMGFSCRIPCVKPLLNNRQRQKRLSSKRTGLLLSGPKLCSLMKVNFAFPLDIRVPESGGREERHTIHVA
uniref:Transposase Tc1-like domain-containing protein n=1 Tax=Cyprinus carpio carpio TaxID=630221 RepID=A0A9J8CAJ3_CYPCA